MYSGHRLFQSLPWYMWALRAVASPAPAALRRRPFSTSAATLRFKKSSLVTRQCRGIRRSDGVRCTRRVKADVICTDETQLYCVHHQPLPDGTSLSPTKLPQPLAKPLRDVWDLWFDRRLTMRKKQELKTVMEQPLSKKEEDGYIYGFVLQHGPRVPTSKFAYFKIGRSIDPVKRMYQVAKKCNYTPDLVEVLPNIPISSRRKSTITTLPKCPASHRVERLIHIELAGVFPRADFRCKACGEVHREWFRIKREIKADGTPSTDRELWMTHIRPMVLKWIQYGVAVSTTRWGWRQEEKDGDDVE